MIIREHPYPQEWLDNPRKKNHTIRDEIEALIAVMHLEKNRPYLRLFDIKELRDITLVEIQLINEKRKLNKIE